MIVNHHHRRKNQKQGLDHKCIYTRQITEDKGITKVSTQQWNLLEEEEWYSNNFGKTVIEDLIVTINKIQSTSHQKISLIDVNESFNWSEKGISSLVEHTGMTYPIANKYDTRNEPNTHKSVSKRIDYIFCTNWLTPFIRLCIILPFDFITTSDHRGLYIDIYLALFLKDPLHQFITNTKDL